MKQNELDIQRASLYQDLVSFASERLRFTNCASKQTSSRYVANEHDRDYGIINTSVELDLLGVVLERTP